MGQLMIFCHVVLPSGDLPEDGATHGTAHDILSCGDTY